MSGLSKENARNFALIGVSSGWGATNTSTYLGPQKVMNSIDPFPQFFLNKKKMLGPTFAEYFSDSKHIQPKAQPPQIFFARSGSQLEIRNIHCFEVIQAVQQNVHESLTINHHRPFVLGGDQSISIGTWSGILNFLHTQENSSRKPLGLIWIDAHLDAHTPQTSPSQALHGMAAAVLLGQGEGLFKYTNLKIMNHLEPDRLIYIGARSYEEGEHQFLKSLGVRIYYQSDVDQRGFETVFEEARTYVTRDNAPYGVSLDIDAFDPVEAPGTGARAPGGLKGSEVFQVLDHIFQDDRLIAFELVEFNPNLDEDDKTLQLIWELFHHMKGDFCENTCKNT
jgi:arginase